MNKESRELTDPEAEHVARLIRRGGETALAALLGVNEGTVRSWQKRERWPIVSLEKALAMEVEQIPPKGRTKKHKPPRASHLVANLTRSEMLYYIHREE